MRDVKDQSALFHEKDLLIAQRKITIFEDIDQESFAKLYKNLAILDKEDKPITVALYSHGGDLRAAKAMYDIIKRTSSFVEFYCHGDVMSAATIILQAADRRISLENTKFMVHLGQEAYGEDHPLNLDRWFKSNKKDEEWMKNLYLGKIKEKNPKFTKKDLNKLLEFDTILSSQETLELGLIDEIAKNPFNI